MQINNCLVIIKQTAMAQGGRAASFARKGDETAKRLVHADTEQKRTLDGVHRALKSCKIAFAKGLIVRLDMSRSTRNLPAFLRMAAPSIRWKRKIAVLCSLAGGKRYGD